MKRLLIITLTVCSYSYISTEGWLTNRLNRFDTTLKHYIPGPYSSINTLPHKDIASRIASMRYLYGPEVTPYQEELINNHLQQNVKIEELNHILPLHTKIGFEIAYLNVSKNMQSRGHSGNISIQTDLNTKAPACFIFLRGQYGPFLAF